jgi:ribosome-binding factor A
MPDLLLSNISFQTQDVQLRSGRECRYFSTFAPMDTTRQQKYNRLFQKEMGDIFQKEGFNFFGRAFVTVTNVKVSPDLGVASFYLSIFGAKDSKAVISQIERHTKEIRKILGTRIRHQARIVPELRFFLDDSLDQVEKIERLLNESRLPPREDKEDAD